MFFLLKPENVNVPVQFSSVSLFFCFQLPDAAAGFKTAPLLPSASTGNYKNNLLLVVNASATTMPSLKIKGYISLRSLYNHQAGEDLEQNRLFVLVS